jgi:hypothetical protein
MGEYRTRRHRQLIIDETAEGATGWVATVDRRRLRSHRHTGDRGPGGKCLTAGGMKPGGGVLVGAAGEEVGDLIVDGEKPLHLPR